MEQCKVWMLLMSAADLETKLLYLTSSSCQNLSQAISNMLASGMDFETLLVSGSNC